LYGLETWKLGKVIRNTWKVLNVALEKDEDHLDRPFEKLSISKSHVGEDYLTHNKKKEG
jgi:hypothetical protein